MQSDLALHVGPLEAQYAEIRPVVQTPTASKQLGKRYPSFSYERIMGLTTSSPSAKSPKSGRFGFVSKYKAHRKKCVFALHFSKKLHCRHPISGRSGTANGSAPSAS